MHLQGQEEAHAALRAEAAVLSQRLATAEAAALLARQQAADNESFSCIRESLSNQVRCCAKLQPWAFTHVQLQACYI